MNLPWFKRIGIIFYPYFYNRLDNIVARYRLFQFMHSLTLIADLIQLVIHSLILYSDS